MFKNHGFAVELAARTRDGGYDILAVGHSGLDTETVLIEVKHFAPNRPVSVGVVRALYGVKCLRLADRAILATSSYVSRNAKREFARVIPWQLEFKEVRAITEWCQSYVNDLLKQESELTEETRRAEQTDAADG